MQDAGGDGSMVAAAVAGAGLGGPVGAALSLSANMAKFANIAAAGGFEVSPEGGDAMIRAIDGFIAWYYEQSEMMLRLEQERRLGGSVAARAIMPFNRQVATDGEGYIPRLKELVESLEVLRHGIVQAMANYHNTDELDRAKIQQVGDTLSA